MIVKFHARGTGGGKGPTQYLLGRDGQREGATLLRGDPEQVAELIDSSRYAKKYTSGVLSFAEADLPPEQKRALMDSFEKALLPGLEARQYSCLWVEHQDKGRLELNFVIPNLELTEGKRLQP
ncbi:relaxase/mobilization nuclease domain-containing protein, partial [Pseudomonas psychrophila]|nr:relaxase/mobilization nuclease domain-containing protein [Pseudomonas psychrophila]MBJ2260113.1 relaxase/mobilization nuclease domain-containing protein [Pseudomonas psychrophila]